MLRELLTMKNLLIAGIAAGVALASAPAMAASDSLAVSVSSLTADEFVGSADFQKGRMPKVMGGHGSRPMPHVGMNRGHRPMHGGGFNNHRWGNRINGRWFAGYHAPGGWMGYRAPSRGFILPSYWINPGYSISNFGMYGLYAPMTGYGWSRYYDDAVLRDSRGYVQDYRTGVDWNRYEGGYAPDNGYRQPEYGPSISADRQVYDMNGSYDSYDESDVEYREGTGAPYDSPEMQDRYYVEQNAPAYAPAAPAYSTPYGYERYERCLRERGVGGGVVGAVIGAVAGNRIAGRGDRLAGSLIGGGLGALAGVGIEKATNKCRRYLPATSSYPAPQYRQPAPQYHPQPAPQYRPAPAPQPHVVHGHQGGYQQGGYYHGGYYYPPMSAPTITTVTVSPTVTTTTTVTEEIYYETVAVRRPATKKWRPKAKPRPKPRCHCH
jgi:Ni/Co efflux regulator RcnB